MTRLAIARTANDQSVCVPNERPQAQARKRTFVVAGTPSAFARDFEKRLGHVVDLGVVQQTKDGALSCVGETMPKHICERNDAEQV